jgi:hypothetical protein
MNQLDIIIQNNHQILIILHPPTGKRAQDYNL